MLPIQVFVRHCNLSLQSLNKNRPPWFNRELCWNNLKATLDPDLAALTALFDGKINETHFLKREKEYPVVECRFGGSDAASLLNLLHYVESLNLPPSVIVYILEDDYMHRPGWCQVLKEAFDQLSPSYATLYDHPDKYGAVYPKLMSKLFVTPSCHWRTTPSTTNTYACFAGTLKRDLKIHREQCSLQTGVAQDHKKFQILARKGFPLISCIPGYSTHCESEYLSPCVAWQELTEASAISTAS